MSARSPSSRDPTYRDNVELLLQEYHLTVYYAPGAPEYHPGAYFYLRRKVLAWNDWDELHWVRRLRQVKFSNDHRLSEAAKRAFAR